MNIRSILLDIRESKAYRFYERNADLAYALLILSMFGVTAVCVVRKFWVW